MREHSGVVVPSVRVVMGKGVKRRGFFFLF